MLPKNKRLNLKYQFKWVASGKRLETRLFKVFAKDGENSTPLVGVAVSSVIFKKSTLRNKAKRISFKIAEAVYQDLRKHLNLVIMPKTGILDVPVNILISEFKKLDFLFD